MSGLIVLIVVIAIAAGAFFWYKKTHKTAAISTPVGTVAVTTPSPLATKTYEP